MPSLVLPLNPTPSANSACYNPAYLFFQFSLLFPHQLLFVGLLNFTNCHQEVLRYVFIVLSIALRIVGLSN